MGRVGMGAADARNAQSPLPIASHFVVDLLSMSIVAFMNQARLPG